MIIAYSDIVYIRTNFALKESLEFLEKKVIVF